MNEKMKKILSLVEIGLTLSTKHQFLLLGESGS